VDDETNRRGRITLLAKPSRVARCAGIAAALAARRTGWSSVRSDTRVRSRGCFAWQIDGARFSSVVVFRAA
jgi:hypothetical protein